MLRNICATEIFWIGEWINSKLYNTRYWYLDCDSSAWERYLTIYASLRSTESRKYAWMYVDFYGKDTETGEELSIRSCFITTRNNVSAQAFSGLVPNGTSSISILFFGESTYDGMIYEIWSSEEDLTGNIYSNDNLPPEYENQENV